MKKSTSKLLTVLVGLAMASQPFGVIAASYAYQVPVNGVDLAPATAGALKATPNAYSFGTLVLGSTATTSTTLQNTGQDSVTITGIDVPAPFSQSNNCPATLVGGASCVVTVLFNPGSAGSYSAPVVVSAGSAGTDFNVSGAAVVPTTNLTVSPNQVSFGSSDVGVTAATQSVTVTNAGNSPATVTGIGVTSGASDFAQSNDCGGTLAPGATCSISVAFTPTAYGPRTGNLNIFEEASGTLYSVALAGSGNAALVAASPSSLDFGSAIVNYSDKTGSVTVSNPGNLTLTGLTADISAGDFSQTSTTCSDSLAAGASCAVTVKFSPTVAGARSAVLRIGSANGGSAAVSLTGSGVAQAPSVRATPTALSFADTVVGSSSTTQQVTFTNDGNVSVGVTSVGLSAGSSNFQVTHTCGSALAVGASCTATATFSPQQAGTLTGSLSAVFSNATLTVSLAGKGTQGAANVSPGSLAFPTTQVAQSSAAQAVTITNTGNRTLTFSGVSVISGSSDFAQSNNCASVEPGAACSINVSFTPSAAGSRTGTLAFSHDGVGPTTVSLSGAGQAASATLSMPGFPATPVGASSRATATLSNTGVGPLSVTVPSAGSVTGTDFSFYATTCGTAVAVGASCTVTVQFRPTSTVARSGQLTIATGAGGRSATLSATGIQGQASASSTSVTFAPTQVGSSSGANAVTVTNTGTDTLTFSSVSVSSNAQEFSQTNNCTSVAPGGTCTINVTFAPQAVGSRSGVVSLAHNGTGNTAIALTGMAQAQSAALSGPTFPATPVGSSSTATATLSNTGVGPLSVTVPSASSVTGSSFSFVSTTCGVSLAIGGSCSITVKFSPTSAAGASGLLAVATGAGTQSVALGSTGIQGYASITPASLSFAARQVGTTSPVQTVTVTNTGTDTLTFTGVGISSGASDYGQSNNCSSVPVGGTCTVNVSFTPAADGTRLGTLSFVHNGGGLASVSLSGSGILPPSVTSASFSTGTVTTGNSATFSWTTSSATSASVSCAGAAVGSGSGTAGSISVTTSGTGTGTCTVTATGAGGGTATASGSLSVVAAPVVSSASFSPSSVTVGGASTFSWATSGASSVSVACTGATGSGAGASGSITVTTASVGTGTCTVTALNAAGTQATRSANLTILAVPVIGTTQNTSTITAGLTTQGSFGWTASGSATSVAASCSGTGNTSGSYSGSSLSGTIYAAGSTAGATITCTATAYNAAGGSASSSKTYSVVSAPSVTNAAFTASTVTSGGTNTLNWSTSGATSASVSCSGAATGSASGTSGALTVGTTGTGTGTCTVTAKNAAGSTATVSRTFSVVAPASVQGAGYTFFSPSVVTAGSASTFNWSTTGASSASVSCSGAGTSATGSGTSGSISVGTSSAGTAACTVTAYNAAGSPATGSASLSVVAAPSVTGASFSPTSVTAGSASTFSWTTSNATSASVSCSGAGASATGSGTSGSISVGTSSAGTATCTVTAYNAANASAVQSAGLTVNPAGGTLTLTPANYTCIVNNSASCIKSITLTVSGATATGLTFVVVNDYGTGAVSISANTCATTQAAGTTCTISIRGEVSSLGEQDTLTVKGTNSAAVTSTGDFMSGNGICCPASWQMVETLERGYVLVADVEAGMHLRAPDGEGWVEVYGARFDRDEIWRLFVDGDVLDVNAGHWVMLVDGSWKQVKDLKAGERIKGQHGQPAVVEDLIELGVGSFRNLQVEGQGYQLGHTVGHNLSASC